MNKYKPLSAFLNKIILGDCIKQLKQLSDNTVDLIFADPPYNLSNNGFTCHAGKRASVNKGQWDKSKGIEEDFEFHYNWILACKRVLKKMEAYGFQGHTTPFMLVDLRCKSKAGI